MSRSTSLLPGIVLCLGALSAHPAAQAQCPATLPASNAALPGPLPLFPADNWWNTDVSTAPVDSNSSAFIAYINNGGTRRLHPDFGGTESTGSVSIYGLPYAIVDGSQPKQAVTFDYWDESDGVNYSTGQGIPFYPIPAQAITEAHWVEGGAPANVDERADSDRHLLIVDCTNKYLYELYNVYYDAAQGKWHAGSGAFFDMKTNNRRPDTWTSADAAGLAIFPGLVRYDEAWNSAIADIGHAFRVTVRNTNGYVYPASHRAGSTAGALPMGARLRLKTSINGQDPVSRTADPNMRKIFRAMQKYGLIVADNGSDMYVTGPFDTRWNNDILNPAFALLSAGDFEVVELGWKPATAAVPALASISANPGSVVGGSSATGSIVLSAATSSPVSGSLTSTSSAVTVPAAVTIGAGASGATFGITTTAVSATTAASLTATYNGVQKTTTFVVNPPPAATATLSTLTLAPTTVKGGTAVTATITLSAPAPGGGAKVTLKSSAPSIAATPASVTVPAGAGSATFTITTARPARSTTLTVSATYGSKTRSAMLTVKRN
jgi:hypothetical protein